MAMKSSRSPNLLQYLICITEANETVYQARFDMESFIIVVDNHASNNISNQRSHFVSSFFPLPHQHIKEISGQISIKGQVTFRCKNEDNEGRIHTLDIKDAKYVPE